MGNGVSQKEEQSVEKSGQTTQFHRVLVEPEYSIPDLVHPFVSDYIDKEKQIIEKDLRDNVHQTHQLGDGDTKPDQDLNDGATSIEECKSMFTETADTGRAIDLSLSNPDLTDLDIKFSDISSERAGKHDDVEAIETEHTSTTGTLQKILLAQNEFYPDNENVKMTKTFDQEQILSNDNVNTVLDVIKGDELTNVVENTVEVDLSFSEQEENTVPYTENTTLQLDRDCSKCPNNSRYDFETEIFESVNACFPKEDSTENKDGLKNKASKWKFFTKMFKFSKRKHNKNPELTPETIDIKSNIQSNNTAHATQLADGKTVTEISYACFDETEALETRLNSLDSGICVDRALQNQITPTRDADIHLHSGNSATDQHEDVSMYNLQTHFGRINDTTIAEEDRDDSKKDFVCTSESNSDVYELENTIKLILPTTMLPHSCMPNAYMLPHSCMPNAYGEDQKKTLDEKISNISSDSGTSMDIKEKADSIRNPVKSKRKKKSWSFQSGGKNKKSDNQENDYCSVNADVSTLQSNKPKWTLRKFSFRRTVNEKYVSTPNLKNPGIPEEGESITFTEKQIDQKKHKLKKIKHSTKAKTNKASESLKLEKRSISLLDFLLGNNAPRSNYGIDLEDDIHITNSDAFEGVSLTDLSLAGDEEVSASLAQLEEQKTHCIKIWDDQEQSNQNFDDKSNIDKFKLKSLFTSMPIHQNAETLHTQEVEACKSLEFEDTAYAIIVDVCTTDGVEYAQVVKPKLVSVVVENRVKSTNVLDQAEAKDIQNEMMPQETLVSNETLNLDLERKEAEILNKEEHLDLKVLPVCKNESQPCIDGKEQGNRQDKNEMDINLQHNDNCCRHALGKETNLPNKSLASMNADVEIGVSMIDDIMYSNKGTDDHTIVNAVIQSIPNITFLEHNVKPKGEFNENQKTENIVFKDMSAANLRSKISSRKVVIMKEAGVQAPDIYIPLDIEYLNKVASVSIGVQVTANELEAEHIDLDFKSSNIIEANLAPAFC